MERMFIGTSGDAGVRDWRGDRQYALDDTVPCGMVHDRAERHLGDYGLRLHQLAASG
jgi:hypothetical protein